MKKSLLLSLISLVGLAQMQVIALEPVIQKFYPALPTAGQTPAFGKSVAMTERFFLVGDPGDDVLFTNAGAVYVHDAKTGKRLRKLTANDAAAENAFGTAVAVSGNIAIVGAPGADSGRGAVYVFDLKKGTPLNKLVGQESNISGGLPDLFGQCLALEGTVAVIGSPGDDQADLGTDSGSVYMMKVLDTNPQTNVIRKVRLPLAEANANDVFGSSVGISGNIAVVGAPGDTGLGKAGAGTVHVFEIPTGQRVLNTPAFDATAGDAFGSSVAIHGDLILVGSPKSETSSIFSNTGSAYLINFVGKFILKKYLPPFSLGGEQFGSAVSLSGSLSLISAPFGQQSAGTTGIAFLFDNLTGNQLRSMSVQDVPTNARYGSSAVIYGNQALIASPGDRDVGTGAGAVYLFQGLSRRLGVNTLVKKGDFAPGAPEAVYAGFNAYQITSQGQNHVMLQASMSGPGSSAGRTQGIWSRMGEEFGLALRTGVTSTPVAGSPLVTGISNPVHTIFGFTSFYAKLKGAGITANNDEHWVLDDGDSAISMIGEGTPLATGQALGSLGQMVNSSSSNRAAMIVGLRSTPTKTVTAAGDSAALMFGMPGNAPIASLIEGTPSPVTGVNYGQVGPRITLGSDRAIVPVVLVSGSVPVTKANNAALVQFRNGAADVLLARKGNAAPVIPANPSAVFEAFLGECVSANGSLLIRATLTGVPKAENEGLWGSGINLLNLIAQKGKKIRSGVDLTYVSFIRYWSTNNGFFVLAKVSGPGVTAANDLVLVHYPSASIPPRLLMREGDIAPDCGGARIGLIQKVEADRNSGFYAVITTLTDSDAASSQAMWTGKVTVLNENVINVEMEKPFLRLRRGSFQELGSTTAALTSIDFLLPADLSGAGGRGLGSPVTSSTVALILTFANKQVIAGPLTEPVGEPLEEVEP